MKTTNIPFGWRNLIDGDCQQDTDWFFNSSGEWQKNPESDNGLPFGVLSSYTMIRRTKINVSPNPNVSYILPNQDNTTLDRMTKDCIALKATHQSEIAELKKQIAHLTKERNKLRDELKLVLEQSDRYDKLWHNALRAYDMLFLQYNDNIRELSKFKNQLGDIKKIVNSK